MIPPIGAEGKPLGIGGIAAGERNVSLHIGENIFHKPPHIQQTGLSTAKTQASDIDPLETRPLSAISRLQIANRMARTYPTQ
jgi:hypothetical protein